MICILDRLKKEIITCILRSGAGNLNTGRGPCYVLCRFHLCKDSLILGEELVYYNLNSLYAKIHISKLPRTQISCKTRTLCNSIRKNYTAAAKILRQLYYRNHIQFRSCFFVAVALVILFGTI